MTEDNQSPSQPLIEGIDYYIEAGCWVFTAAYHLRRGFCCQSGCRHCPYRPDNATPATETPSKRLDEGTPDNSR